MTDSMRVFFSRSPYSEATLTHGTLEHGAQPGNEHTNSFGMIILNRVKTGLYIYIYLQTSAGGKEKSAEIRLCKYQSL